MVTDRSFLKRLQSAKDNPNSDEAKLLAKSINKHVTMANSNVPYTADQRKSSVSHLYNMARFYGTPSIFFTFAPDDINGCLNLRMALPLSDNFTFPNQRKRKKKQVDAASTQRTWKNKTRKRYVSKWQNCLTLNNIIHKACERWIFKM